MSTQAGPFSLDVKEPNLSTQAGPFFAKCKPLAGGGGGLVATPPSGALPDCTRGSRL